MTAGDDWSDGRARENLQASSPIGRRTSAALAFLAVALVAGASSAEGLRIRVRGSAKIAARATRDQGELVLAGSLADDAGQALANQAVTIRVTREADPRDPAVAEALRKAHVCDRPAGGAPRAHDVSTTGPRDAPEIVAVTDDDGRFCFRARLDPDRYKATLHWRPPATGTSSLLDPIDRDIAFDLSRLPLELRFDPAPRIVRLDAEQTTFDVVAFVDEDATKRVAPRLTLSLGIEQGGAIATAVTDGGGRARFTVDTSKLGEPGPGELRVSFAGDAETAQALLVEEVERHVKVALRVPAADEGQLTPKVPEEGIPLLVEVGSAVGPVGEGSVEARVGEVLVGVAPVERGIARPTLTFTAQGKEAFVRLRYVPSSPWYEAGDEITKRIPIRGPGILSKAPILVAGLAVLAFFLAGRVSSRKAKPEPKRPEKSLAERDGKPRIEVVKAAAKGEQGWRGTVVDAHEGTPVAGARVWIDRGTFEGRHMLASVASDEDGRFEISAPPSLVGDEQISAEAPLHARLTQALPGPGEISIALAARKRALLARLVTWAKRRGPPFDAKPEPTPGHVRRAAGEDLSTARWADAVERAVFGEGVVDAHTEREIEKMSPEGEREDVPRR